MATQWYIHETNSKLNESAFYGPFEESEIVERCNDAFADYLASGLANIDAVKMTDKEAAEYYINPRSFWMSQLETLDFVGGAVPNDFGDCTVCLCPLTKNGCENVAQHPRILSHT